MGTLSTPSSLRRLFDSWVASVRARLSAAFRLNQLVYTAERCLIDLFTSTPIVPYLPASDDQYLDPGPQTRPGHGYGLPIVPLLPMVVTP